jgi:hypothetical protein
LPTPEILSILCCNCHLFSLIFAELNSWLPQFYLSAAWDSRYIASGRPPQETPLSLLLHVDSLLQRCV